MKRKRYTAKKAIMFDGWNVFDGKKIVIHLSRYEFSSAGENKAAAQAITRLANQGYSLPQLRTALRVKR